MIDTVKLSDLSPELQKMVRAEYRLMLLRSARKLTYMEAAWLYGYTYQSIRTMACTGRLRTGGKGRIRWLTHDAMRSYIRNKRNNGTPRLALKNAQTAIQP